MPTVFSRIVAGEIPCYKVAENEDFIAFLDISPLHEGHTLVVPKLEVDYIFALPEGVLSGLLPFAGQVARAIEAVVPCARIGVAVIGLEVPHAHMHLVPIDGLGDLDFTKPRVEVAEARYRELASRIGEAFAAQ